MAALYLLCLQVADTRKRASMPGSLLMWKTGRERLGVEGGVVVTVAFLHPLSFLVVRAEEGRLSV